MIRVQIKYKSSIQVKSTTVGPVRHGQKQFLVGTIIRESTKHNFQQHLYQGCSECMCYCKSSPPFFLFPPASDSRVYARAGSTSFLANMTRRDSNLRRHKISVSIYASTLYSPGGSERPFYGVHVGRR